MNRDECAHVFTAWPEWGPDQLMVCDKDCGARATMRDPSLIEASLRERIATEIEAHAIQRVSRLVGGSDEHRAVMTAVNIAVEVIRGADQSACPECGHSAESHGDWNWPVKCLIGPCDCRTSGATIRANQNGADHD